MRLNEQDYYQFLRLHHALLLYAGQKNGLAPKTMDAEKFLASKDVNLKLECREALLKDPKIIDGFVKENPSGLPAEDLEIAAGFKDMVSGRFIILKFLKEHTIFTKDDYAYGVLALNDPLDAVLRYESPPIMVEAVLLPFKGKIIYDGMLMPYNVRFGSGYRSSFNESYRQGKAKYGIITSLPFGGEKAWDGESPSGQLAYFMKTKANREEFGDKIDALLKKHPQLLPEYHQAWGKIHAARYKKQFKPLGLSKAQYAILEGHLISSAPDKKALEATLKKLVPKGKQGWVYVFGM